MKIQRFDGRRFVTFYISVEYKTKNDDYWQHTFDFQKSGKNDYEDYCKNGYTAEIRELNWSKMI